MPLSFEPLTPNKIEEMHFIPNGTPVKLMLQEADEKGSNYGDFFTLDFKANWNGREYQVSDTLSANQYGIERLFSYCVSANLEEKYYEGKIYLSDIQKVKTIYGIIYRKKSKNPQYPDRNGVSKYISEAEFLAMTAKNSDPQLPSSDTRKAQSLSGARIDDEIPW